MAVSAFNTLMELLHFMRTQSYKENRLLSLFSIQKVHTFLFLILFIIFFFRPFLLLLLLLSLKILVKERKLNKVLFVWQSIRKKNIEKKKEIVQNHAVQGHTSRTSKQIKKNPTQFACMCEYMCDFLCDFSTCGIFFSNFFFSFCRNCRSVSFISK